MISTPPQPSAYATRRGAHFICACVALLTVWSIGTPAAGAEICPVDDVPDMRRSVSGTVHRSLNAIDVDLDRATQVFGDSGDGVATVFVPISDFPGRCAADPSIGGSAQVYLRGVHGHASIGDVRMRALVLGARSRYDWVSTNPEAEVDDLVYGGLVGYRDWLEVGLLRMERRKPRPAAAADGWIATLASHGVRVTGVLGDDRVDMLTLGLDRLPVGPLALSAGVRHVPKDDLWTGYAVVHGLELGSFVDWGRFLLDGHVETELAPARLHSAITRLRFAFDYLGQLDPVPGSPPELRAVIEMYIGGGVYAGSGIGDGDPLPALGAGGSFAVYMMNFGLSFSAAAGALDPTAFDLAVTAQDALQVEAMINLHLYGFTRYARRDKSCVTETGLPLNCGPAP